jgi:hypothetical protein
MLKIAAFSQRLYTFSPPGSLTILSQLGRSSAQNTYAPCSHRPLGKLIKNKHERADKLRSRTVHSHNFGLGTLRGLVNERGKVTKL